MGTRLSALVLLLPLFASCAPISSAPTTGQVESRLKTDPLSPEVTAKLKHLDGMTEDQLIATYRNKTRIGYEPSHGTQIEYTSANGQAWLWYPGNTVIIPGEWKRKDSAENYEFPANEGEGKTYTVPKTEICFRYGKNTHNPVTGHRGGGFECNPIALMKLLSDETIVSGDIFGLAGRKAVPFVLPKRKQLSINDVNKRL